MIMNEITGVVDSVNASWRGSDWQLVNVIVRTELQVEVSKLVFDALRLAKGDPVVLSIPDVAISIGRRTPRIEWGLLAPDQFRKSINHVDPLGTVWDVEVEAANADTGLLQEFLRHSLLFLSAMPISDEDYKRGQEQARPFDRLESTAAPNDTLYPQINIRYKLLKPVLQGPVRVSFIAIMNYSGFDALEEPRDLEALVVQYGYDAYDTSDGDVDIGYTVSGAGIDLYLGTSTSANLPHRGPLSGEGQIYPAFSVTTGSSGFVTVQAQADTRWYRLTLDINEKWS